MNAGNAFRSHLMQQFASAARQQTRPPLAMVPWLPASDHDNGNKSKRSGRHHRRHHSTSPSAAASLSSVNSTSTNNNNTTTSSTTTTHGWRQSSTSRHPQQRQQTSTSSPSSPTTRRLYASNPHSVVGPSDLRSSSSRSLSSAAKDDDNQTLSNANTDEKKEQHGKATSEENTQNTVNNEEGDTSSQQQQQQHPLSPSPLAQSFQAMIQTRRTTSHFAPASSSDRGQHNNNYSFWSAALDRAVECARRAPNHKRTEPFMVHRMIAPSPTTQQLANIAYHVALKKTSSQQKADQKRDKWNAIPAFLVVMVRSKPTVSGQDQEKNQLYPSVVDTDEREESPGNSDFYEPLPFVPISTEREIEDYAAACAALENALLSLHSEDIATKWATGPVLQTPAFRRLVGATPNDRMVGLVMVGKAQQEQWNRMKPRRYRTSWQDFSKTL